MCRLQIRCMDFSLPHPVLEAAWTFRTVTSCALTTYSRVVFYLLIDELSFCDVPLIVQRKNVIF